MAQARSTRAINLRGKNSVRNLQYGPRARLVRGIYVTIISATYPAVSKVAICFQVSLFHSGTTVYINIFFSNDRDVYIPTDLRRPLNHSVMKKLRRKRCVYTFWNLDYCDGFHKHVMHGDCRIKDLHKL